jgi:glutamate-5-semialdehyde dehydrogenase
MTSIENLALSTRRAAARLAVLGTEARTQALEAVAQALERSAREIVAANEADREAAQADGISPALLARLKLDESKLRSEIAGLRSVAALPDPVGRIDIHRELDEGLVLARVSCPLGVIAVIFEARPDAVIQIASLALKSGNGVILKGGSEALRSCRAIVDAIHAGLATSPVDPEAVLLLSTREESTELLALDGYVDLVIPRGSNALVRFVQQNTRIPVLGHADGICHLYVDRAADLDMAVALAVDSKTQYPAACNAIETLLVHMEIAHVFLPKAAAALGAKGVTLRVDPEARAILDGVSGVAIEDATEADWRTEYGDLVLSVRVLDSLEAAIEHINTFGSHHTDAIVTGDTSAAEAFVARVDSAGVYHNCSTRFADGNRYGFGAEVGISTQKMPPRGPVGLEGLVTYRYQIRGSGQVVADYTGAGARRFTHRDL